MEPFGYSLNRAQLERLGVRDVQDDGRLSVGMRVTVTDGHWSGRTGQILRIQRDASAGYVVHNVLVDLDGTCCVVFGPAFLNEMKHREGE